MPVVDAQMHPGADAADVDSGPHVGACSGSAHQGQGEY